MAKGDLIVKAEIDDEKISLTLTAAEIESALSVCHINAIDMVYCLKAPQAGALFFSEERNAVATQDQDKFSYLWTLQQKDLAAHAKKEKIELGFEKEPVEEPAKSNTGGKPPKLDA